MKTGRAVGAASALGLLLAGLGCATAGSGGPMTAGHKLYLSKCTACHSAYEPSQYTPARWEGIVADMERARRVTLTPEDRALVLSYLSRTEPKPLPAATR